MVGILNLLALVKQPSYIYRAQQCLIYLPPPLEDSERIAIYFIIPGESMTNLLAFAYLDGMLLSRGSPIYHSLFKKIEM